MFKSSKLEMFNFVLLVIILILVIVCCIRKCNEKFTEQCSRFNGEEKERCLDFERQRIKDLRLGVNTTGRDRRYLEHHGSSQKTDFETVGGVVRFKK